MAQQYYTLVAGLREYELDAENKGFDTPAIIDYVYGQLSERDREYLEMFYAYYDIENIINILAGRARFSSLGNFSRRELEEELEAPADLPPFVRTVLAAYKNPDDSEDDETYRTRSIEKALFTAYYRECEKSRCRFIRDWYAFDRNLRNITAAYTARRLGRHVAEELVGDGYVVDMLARSTSSDFGLRGELDYMDRIMAALDEESNVIEREQAVDLLRWDMADELTVFDYFNVNAVLAYLVKVNAVHRWMALDPVRGREMFRNLMASISSEGFLREEQAENSPV